MTSVVPLEISDWIIYQLRDDRKALLSCSLVCRSWRVRAQYHIFRSVTLVGVSPRVVRNLGAALTQNPHLTAHICHVEVPLALEGCDAFVEHCPLPNVETLTLRPYHAPPFRHINGNDPENKSSASGSESDYEPQSEHACPKLIPYDALEVAFPSTRFLSIEHIGFMYMATVANILLSFPHLTSLRLRGISISTPMSHPVRDKQRDVSLEFLQLLDCPGRGAYVMWLLGSDLRLNVNSLRRLQFRGGSAESADMTKDVGRLAGRLSTTLEEVDIDALNMDVMEDILRIYHEERRTERPTLHSLCLRIQLTDDTQVCFVRLVQMLRIFNPHAPTQVTLEARASPSAYQRTWDDVAHEITREAFPWTCTIIIAVEDTGEDIQGTSHLSEGSAALRALGITVVEQMDWTYTSSA